jgi:uncharacterized protein (TIGR02452 family)
MSTSNEPISREIAAQYGLEAVKIGAAGRYQTASGRTIELAAAIERAVLGTKSYPPDVTLESEFHGTHATGIEIRNETTLSAARRQYKEGYHPVVLNFASATHPGGGFLMGAIAQEEYLARSTCLYQCIWNHPMYEFNRQNDSPFYTDYLLYSPHVPVFRDDQGELLEHPYNISIITAPAVNARFVAEPQLDKVAPVMWKRILRVLAVGILHWHDAIVLGAWGCGAFGNDPRMIASLFHKALFENFNGAYQHVIFAILDWSTEKSSIGPFEDIFANTKD